MHDIAFLLAWLRLHAPVFRAWLGLRLPPVWAWIKRRAGERSTWIGLAMAASALGQSVWADHLTKAADIVPMLLGAGGLALAAASTKSRPPGDDTTTKDTA